MVDRTLELKRWLLVAVLKKDTMISLAENAVNEALKSGASEAEAYVYEGQATNIGIELGQISKTNRRKSPPKAYLGYNKAMACFTKYH